jgi:ribosomal protein S2
MKIKSIIKYKNRLLKLKLIKTKMYKKPNRSINTQIEDVEYRLKKALHVIYKYHMNNKKILFIGVPVRTDKETKSVINNTKHTFLPKSAWVNGVITNKASCFKYLLQNPKASVNRSPKLLLKLEDRSDLVVVFDKTADKDALNEIYLARIPVISLNCDLNLLKNKSCYKIPGNFQFTEKKVRNDFFFSILKATFKKADQLKSRNSYKPSFQTPRFLSKTIN